MTNLHPSPAGCHKINRETALEAMLIWLGIIWLGLSAICYMEGRGYYTRMGRYHPPNPDRKALSPKFLSLAILFFGFRYFTDNHYLLDPAQRRLWYHFSFLGFRRITSLLEARDILALAVNGRRFHSRAGGRWKYRIEVADYHGKQIPLTDWTAYLEEVNGHVVEYAAMLGCQVLECPGESRLVVNRSGRLPQLEYQPWPWWRQDKVYFLVMLVIIVLAMMGLRYWARHFLSVI